eukprot:TRINITY_DN12449_c0_g1_i2.p1 TRINITY_DN12449_c0_g1~~TRINITY_DN12449_c0_g1_i2.p1  ORF type:complete len:381 (+),score=64.41 TRINITY_DN12449_c0_g1_i2:48-1145(+)
MNNDITATLEEIYSEDFDSVSVNENDEKIDFLNSDSNLVTPTLLPPLSFPCHPSHIRELALCGDRIYCSDLQCHCIYVIDRASGSVVQTWGNSNSPASPSPEASSPVSPDASSPVSPDAVPVSLYRPRHLACDPTHDRLFLSDCNHHRLLTLRLSDGQVLSSWGGPHSGVALSQFHYPKGIAFHAASQCLYVADEGNHRVQILRADTGECVGVLGTARGSGRDQLNCPCDVAVDDDVIYVCDRGNHRIVRFSRSNHQWLGVLEEQPDGAVRRTPKGKLQPHASTLQRPWSVCLDSIRQRLWIAEHDRGQIQARSTVDGQVVMEFAVRDGHGRFCQPWGVWWDEERQIVWVTAKNEEQSILAYQMT